MANRYSPHILFVSHDPDALSTAAALTEKLSGGSVVAQTADGPTSGAIDEQHHVVAIAPHPPVRTGLRRSAEVWEAGDLERRVRELLVRINIPPVDGRPHTIAGV